MGTTNDWEAGMPKDRIRYHEPRAAGDDVARYLEALARAIRHGAIQMEAGEEALALQIGDGIAFDVTAASAKSKATIELSLAWKSGVGRGARAGALHIMPASELSAETKQSEDGARPQKTGSSPRPVAKRKKAGRKKRTKRKTAKKAAPTHSSSAG